MTDPASPVTGVEARARARVRAKPRAGQDPSAAEHKSQFNARGLIGLVGLTAVFAADAVLDVGVLLLALGGSHLDKLAHTLLIEDLEWIAREDALCQVSLVVAGE